MSLPTCADKAAQAYPPKIAQMLDKTDAAAIFSPVLSSISKDAPEVPWFSISAASVEIINAPVTSIIKSRMVATHNFQWGLINCRISFIRSQNPFFIIKILRSIHPLRRGTLPLYQGNIDCVLHKSSCERTKNARLFFQITERTRYLL